MVMNEKPILVEYDRRQLAVRMLRAVELAGVGPRDCVLDVGCGNTELKDFLPATVEYVGVDYYKMLPFVIEHDISKGLPYQLRDQRFDAIFLLEFLEHMENFKSILEDCKRVLKPDGAIIVSVPNPKRFHFDEHPDHIHSFTPLNMQNLARQIGMRVARKTGTYIPIPLLHKHVPSKSLLLTDTIVYALKLATG